MKQNIIITLLLLVNSALAQDKTESYSFSLQQAIEHAIQHNYSAINANRDIEAAKQKHNVIMTPNSYVYFDYAQNKQEDSLVIGGYLTVQKVYSYEPVPAALAAEDTKYILGAQANVWSEYMKTPAKVEYMVFPRMSALSEVLWSRKESRNWSDFEKRMEKQTKRYELWNASYNKKYLDPANK